MKLDLLAGQPSILSHNRRCVLVLQQEGLQLALVIIGGFLVDSVRMDPEIRPGAKVAKGQYLGAFALGGSAILMLTSAPLDVEPVLSESMSKFPHPVKVQVGRSFANVASPQ